MSAEADSSAAELPTIFAPETLQRKGLCPVSKVHGQENSLLEQHSIYYELHGRGPERILFIMGMNSSAFSWLPQVEYFSRIDKYSVLVFDNRGVGNSSSPRGPYTTQGMSTDILVLLDMLGWTESRSLHVVGVSLGGMIAQELALLIGDRIISLTLGVTTPGGYPWQNFFATPWKGVSSLTRLTFMTDWDKKIPIILAMLFPLEWLAQPAKDDPAGRTNREVQTEAYLRRIAIMRPQTLMGNLSHMSAALTHRVSPDRLQHISKTIPKILIITGDYDHLVEPSNSLRLKAHMPEAEYIIWKDCGHAFHAQFPALFHSTLERVFVEGRSKLDGTVA